MNRPINVITSSQADNRRRIASIAGENRQIYWEFSGDVLPPVSENADFATIAFLPFAMAHGRDLHVHQIVSPSLLGNLEEFQDVWCRWRGDRFRPIRIRADEEKEPRDTGSDRTAVAAYSGGVDATYMAVQHGAKRLGHRNRDIVAALMIHGFDIPEDADGAFEAGFRQARGIIDEFEIPLTRVKTNWRRFSADWGMMHVVGVAAILHQYVGVADIGLLAYDYLYGREPLPWGNNSITNHLLSSRRFSLESCGGATSRTEKCAVIGRYAKVKTGLRVCWAGPMTGFNCGTCEKCVRTKLNFLAAGVGSIPALPGTLVPTDIERLSITGQSQLNFFSEILDYDTVHRRLPADLHNAVANKIAIARQETGEAPAPPRHGFWRGLKHLVGNTRAQR